MRFFRYSDRSNFYIQCNEKILSCWIRHVHTYSVSTTRQCRSGAQYQFYCVFGIRTNKNGIWPDEYFEAAFMASRALAPAFNQRRLDLLTRKGDAPRGNAVSTSKAEATFDRYHRFSHAFAKINVQDSHDSFWPLCRADTVPHFRAELRVPDFGSH